MFIRRSLSLLAVFVLAASYVSAQQAGKPSKRDVQAIEILTRTVTAAGGLQALLAVHDLTESGEINFYWGEGVKGPVTIRILRRNHFRMDADLPEGKLSWIVKAGTGWKKKGEEKASPLPYQDSINLENLTFPLAHVGSALADATTDVSFVGIEKREGRSAYRIRVKGGLGLVAEVGRSESVTKDLLIDALNFELLRVEDHPHPTYRFRNRSEGKSEDESEDTTPRDIELGDFRVVGGVRVPFSITTKVHDQQILQIRLTEVIFNKNIADNEFKH